MAQTGALPPSVHDNLHRFNLVRFRSARDHVALEASETRRAFTGVLDDDGVHADAQLIVLGDDLSGAGSELVEVLM